MRFLVEGYLVCEACGARMPHTLEFQFYKDRWKTQNLISYSDSTKNTTVLRLIDNNWICVNEDENYCEACSVSYFQSIINKNITSFEQLKYCDYNERRMAAIIRGTYIYCKLEFYTRMIERFKNEKIIEGIIT